MQRDHARSVKRATDPEERLAGAPARSEDVVAEEERHLDEALALLRFERRRTAEMLERIDAGYHEAKRYQVEHRGDIDPTESYQNELVLQDIDRRASQAAETVARFDKLIDSPYFARIDFVTGEERVAHYVGRFSCSCGGEVVVSDWRSPVAGLFYERDETGPASYDAPSGRVEGVLALKRQLSVERGGLVYAADTSSSVRDEVLARQLSASSEGGMRSIIASIQAEQNRVIRDEAPGTLVIQGAAGSGKTSIALHRVAYLLYRRKGELSSRSVAILSPNRVFGDYIANVLPELGEEPLVEMTLAQLLEALLDGVADFEQPRSSVDDVDGGWPECARFKGSRAFSDELLAYLDDAPSWLFHAEDLVFGRRAVSAAELDERFRAHGGLPVDERLDLLAANVVYDLESTAIGRDRHALPTRRVVRGKLAGMLQERDALALYRRFFREIGQEGMLSSRARRTRCVEWEDACPLALARGVFAGFDERSDVKHLVIDEMQDLSPTQHALVARLFRCDKTILGDSHQTVSWDGTATLADLEAAYEGARVVRLTRSYRSTFEIVSLASRVKPAAGLVAVERHGEEPRIVACANTAEVLERVRERIDAFRAGDRRTLGVLHASGQLARRYFELLPPELGARLLTDESAEFSEGVSVASVAMAKGLEFDEVVILDADERFFSSELGRSLLYVAVTRAMHKLTILHRGNLSPFLR